MFIYRYIDIFNKLQFIYLYLLIYIYYISCTAHRSAMRYRKIVLLLMKVSLPANTVSVWFVSTESIGSDEVGKATPPSFGPKPMLPYSSMFILGPTNP